VERETILRAVTEKVHAGERLSVAPVIGLIVLIGLMPQLITDSVNPTVVNLLAHWRF